MLCIDCFFFLYRTLGARELLFSTPLRCAFFSRAKVSGVIPHTIPGHKTIIILFISHVYNQFPFTAMLQADQPFNLYLTNHFCY